MNDITKLDDIISLVKDDMIERFPDCSYTIRILLWNDDTSLVECRHGDGKKLHISRYYQDKLVYEEIDISFTGNMMVGEDGREYFPRINF